MYTASGKAYLLSPGFGVIRSASPNARWPVIKSAATWAEKGPNIYYMTQTIAEEDNIFPDSMEMEVANEEKKQKRLLICF